MILVVVNACYGGFGLSDVAMARYKELGGKEEWARSIARDNPILVQVVQELGETANDGFASLRIAELPDDVKDNWHIHEYDGLEHVAENHRTW